MRVALQNYPSYQIKIKYYIYQYVVIFILNVARYVHYLMRRSFTFLCQNTICGAT